MTAGDARVFVVDDDHAVRTALKRLITSLGFTVEAFESAKAFLERGVHEGPSCLVLDVRMPGMSGLELQERLRSGDRRIPIVFITGHGSISMSVGAMKAGAVDFIEKPFEDQRLVDAINAAINRDAASRSDQAVIGDLKRRFLALTPREREVLALVVSGLRNKEIAFDLGMSEKTVKVHRARVMEKMQAESLAGLVRMADRLAMFPAKP
jgi:FixJ family two-component response regulator